jgi:hypothetical protein
MFCLLLHSRAIHQSIHHILLCRRCLADDAGHLNLCASHAQHTASVACAQGLRALDRVFGSDTNSKGFKVIRGAGVIQVGVLRNSSDSLLSLLHQLAVVLHAA